MVFYDCNGAVAVIAETMTATPLTHRSSPPAAATKGTMLSHHAIMALVEPFSRRGYSVDLAASKRDQGVLVFRPTDLPPASGGGVALRCELRLERPHREKVRVIRTLERADGLAATMVAVGDEVGALLEAVERVDPARHFHAVEGGTVARSYRIEVWSADAPRRGRRPWSRRASAPWLAEAEAHFGHVRLVATDTDGGAFEVRLGVEKGYDLDVPMDFLAVIGWRWRPLRPEDEQTWRGSVKLPLWEPYRTATLERQLDAAVTHVADTLAASPARFHPSHRRARWRAAFQRLLPLLFVFGTATSIVLAVMYLPRFAGLQMLLHHVSIVAIVALAMMDRAYRLEIPPCPSPLTRSQWFAPTATIR